MVTTLANRIESTTARASRDGSLIPIPTEARIVEDGGIEFLIHITTLQEKKTRAKKDQLSRPFNPFLPPDPDLFIGDVGLGHLMVLNKFNVLARHLLIVTREFEEQERLLNRDDFSALGACMSEIDGLGFYNGGTVAGASQPHKHLQLVPLPLEPGKRPTPIDAVIPSNTAAGVPSSVDAFDFTHALIPLDGRPITADRAGEFLEHYTLACGLVGVHDETRPYNLLLTRRWMLVVPRTREFWQGVSINALGFAGSLLVRNREELDALERTGPLSILKSVVEDEP
jgi:ATP adenylyltransferase